MPTSARVKVHQIAAWHTGATEFQIERRFDGSITYRADAAEYTSTVQADGVLYPVAHMYRSWTATRKPVTRPSARRRGD